ncbi:MAG: hypothetical protein AAB739_04440 [Patescibacteria group bacterium]
MEKFQPRPLEKGFETEYANDLILVDTLWGGDVGIPGAQARFIADAYPDPKTEVQLPPAYSDSQVVALRHDNEKPDDRKLSAEVRAELIRDIVGRYNLLDIPELLPATLGRDTPPLRRRFVENMGGCFDVMARLAASKADNRITAPSFEERYRAAIHREPELLDTVELRESLRVALAGVGLEVTNGRNLQETAAAYAQQVGIVSPAEFESEVARVTGELMEQVRKNIFEKLKFQFTGHAGEHLEDVKFDGLNFKAFDKPDSHVSGSSCYLGGLTPDGKPAFRDLVEFNAGHPITRPALYHLSAHEMKPGHYIDSVVSDLGWRSGRLGFEAVGHTMCTAECTAREGWAQKALEMAFGGTQQAVIDALGREHAVEFALDRLVDAGKHNGPILMQRDGKSPDEVKEYFAKDCVQSPLYVRKLAAWSRHPILGSMYAPGYAVGYDVLTKAVEKHGALRVAEIALHQEGYQDIDTFQRAL